MHYTSSLRSSGRADGCIIVRKEIDFRSSRNINYILFLFFLLEICTTRSQDADAVLALP